MKDIELKVGNRYFIKPFKLPWFLKFLNVFSDDYVEITNISDNTITYIKVDSDTDDRRSAFSNLKPKNFVEKKVFKKLITSKG